MGKIDVWTDEHVDYAIHLLVLAEAAVRESAPELYEKIRTFLLEKA